VKAGVIFILLLLDLLRWDAHWVKSLLPPAAARDYFERRVILTISLREIVKMTRLSKHNSAQSAMKRLFTRSLLKFFEAKPRILLVNKYIKYAIKKFP